MEWKDSMDSSLEQSMPIKKPSLPMQFLFISIRDLLRLFSVAYKQISYDYYQETLHLVQQIVLGHDDFHHCFLAVLLHSDSEDIDNSSISVLQR